MKLLVWELVKDLVVLSISEVTVLILPNQHSTTVMLEWMHPVVQFTLKETMQTLKNPHLTRLMPIKDLVLVVQLLLKEIGQL